MTKLSDSFVILVVGLLTHSHAKAGVVSFITPCKANNKACLMSSAQAAIPKLTAGISELNIPASDSLKIGEVIGDQGDLKLKFTDITVDGISKCKVTNLERDSAKSTLIFEVQCPISVAGQYEMSGKILVISVEGKDKFKIYTDKIKISVEASIETVEGKDGKSHWKVASWTHSYQPVEIVHYEMDNLFNGNKALSDPVEKILTENWKEVTEEIGKPIVKEILNIVIDKVSSFFSAVPTDELEIV